MATATKKKSAPKKAEEKDQLEEDLEVFDTVSKSVKRTLEHPETGETKEFNQHELAFIPKTRFFRLVSGTLRLAADDGTGVNSLINELFGDAANLENEDLVMAAMRLVELSPDFLEEAFVYALNVKPSDKQWVREAIETIDDDTGLDIIDVFIVQNAPAIKAFLPKIQKIAKRASKVLNLEEAQ